MLRVPRGGGVPHVSAFPAIDSTKWTGTDALPAIERVLAFDAEEGLIAAVDNRGLPVWLDLRVGTVTRTGRGKPRDMTSVDGSTIYAVGADGVVARFTPPGNWTFTPPQPAAAVFPQINGSLLILVGRGANARLLRIHPPESVILDSLAVADASTGTAAPLGDRVYLVMRSRSLVGIQTRTMNKGAAINFDHSVNAIAATPSGDRFYVITDSSTRLSVVDPLQERVTARIDLPGRPRDLRVDPFGRYVLARAATGDSIWVVSIGTDKVVGTVRSTWRADLPFVAPDGTIATIDSPDVVFQDAATGREVRRADDGASEFWYAFVWTGLRPRAQGLDAPAKFSTDSDTTAKVAPPKPVVVDPPRKAAPPPPVARDSARTGYTVSFAVLLNEAKARELAAKITVDGKPARVVAGVNEGIPVFRVILGPYFTREEADRVGRASGQSYYVYAGSP
jgi:cell division septation protein DedD